MNIRLKVKGKINKRHKEKHIQKRNNAMNIKWPKFFFARNKGLENKMQENKDNNLKVLEFKDKKLKVLECKEK